MKKEKKTILISLSKHFKIVIILFSICTIIISLYSTLRYFKFQNAYIEKSLDYYSNQLVKSVTEAYTSYENISYNIAYSKNVHDYLTSTTSGDSYTSYQSLRDQLSNARMLSPYIVDIALYGNDRKFVSLCGAIENYEDMAKSISDTHFSFRSLGIAQINMAKCHIMSIPIYSLEGNQDNYLGLLFLSIDVNSLLDNNINSNNNQYNPQIIFTHEDQLIYGSKSIYHSLETKNTPPKKETSLDRKYVINEYTIPNINHTLYVLINKSIANKQLYEISRQLLLYMISLSFIFFLLLFTLYHPLIRSLNQLTSYMKTIAEGDRRIYRKGYVIKQGIIASTEIYDIQRAFKNMIEQTELLNRKIFDTYTRMYELEDNARKTEIAFLRSQINPHFLYNTLTMICGMAAENDTGKIISITEALSRIYRYSIKGTEKVPLKEEMEIVKNYLMIQKERFGDRFQIEYSFSESSLYCMIPRMIIQPIVENAIVHGLEKSLEPGRLLIGAGLNPNYGYLAIWIYDNGVGMSSQKLESLREKIASSQINNSKNNGEYKIAKDAPISDSIGLLNVNSRMVLYYGTNYTLLLDSEEGVGTNVQIRVPYEMMLGSKVI